MAQKSKPPAVRPKPRRSQSVGSLNSSLTVYSNSDKYDDVFKDIVIRRNEKKEIWEKLPEKFRLDNNNNTNDDEYTNVDIPKITKQYSKICVQAPYVNNEERLELIDKSDHKEKPKLPPKDPKKHPLSVLKLPPKPVKKQEDTVRRGDEPKKRLNLSHSVEENNSIYDDVAEEDKELQTQPPKRHSLPGLKSQHAAVKKKETNITSIGDELKKRLGLPMNPTSQPIELNHSSADNNSIYDDVPDEEKETLATLGKNVNKQISLERDFGSVYDEVANDEEINSQKHWSTLHQKTSLPKSPTRLDGYQSRRTPVSKTSLKACTAFQSRVNWTYEFVKETRDMYEKNKVLTSVLYPGELKMFKYLDEIEEVLFSFKGHLEVASGNVFKVLSLLKEWLENDYFICFEDYYMNLDIQQNLVSFVKETRPAFHQILQGLNTKFKEKYEQKYSFNDLERRFEEPKTWFLTLTFHEQEIKRSLTSACENNVSRIEHETRKLLKEKHTQLVERYEELKKNFLNHSSTIIGRLEFEKNEHCLINPEEASLIVGEDYANIQGNFLNVNFSKKSKYGKSAYSGEMVYLVLFEKAVLLTSLEEKKKKRTYRVLECCDRNYVDIETLPKKASPHQYSFVLYFYKEMFSESKEKTYSVTQYIIALAENISNQSTVISDVVNAIVVPENGNYLAWSRPKYRIFQRYTDPETGILFLVGDQVEVFEETDNKGLIHVERLKDKQVCWIPSYIGRQLENEFKKSVDLKYKKRTERELERESKKKKRKQRSNTYSF